MSLIGTEIRELRELLGLLKDGKISQADVNARLKIYKATADRERMILDMHKLATLKSLSLNSFSKIGMFSKDELLPDTHYNNEKVYCPDQDKVITRDECLDYSGDTRNCESCSSCDNFGPTRKKLL